ncbi:MAG: hypothetical protein ACTHM8_03755 [Sphingomonas sp.]
MKRLLDIAMIIAGAAMIPSAAGAQVTGVSLGHALGSTYRSYYQPSFPAPQVRADEVSCLVRKADGRRLCLRFTDWKKIATQIEAGHDVAPTTIDR